MKPIAAANRWWSILLGAALASGLLSTCLIEPATAAECPIDGPEAVSVNEAFTLCASQGSSYSYEWHGPGLNASSRSRCVTVSGRAAGAYEYELIVRSGGIERERCTHTVNVGMGGFGSLRCTITGPTSIAPGDRVDLCAPSASNHSYHWTGPGGFVASTPCITVQRPGTYDLSIVNDVSGYTRECSHTVAGSGGTDAACAISGPASIASGGTADLCAPSYSNSSYSWRGPGGFQSTQRCVTVRVAGVYRLSIVDRRGGVARQCSYELAADDNGPEDADQVVSDNCPRPVSFWQRQCGRSETGRRMGEDNFTLAELRSIARCVDDRSTYFNWSDDLTGFCNALNPARPLTYRKQVARNQAALLANLCAGELGITMRNGDPISLDPDTPVSFGSIQTIGELTAFTDRSLARGSRGFSRLNQMLSGVNNGRGIGSVCP